MSATVQPCSVSAEERGLPACPEPMMMASYFTFHHADSLSVLEISGAFASVCFCVLA